MEQYGFDTEVPELVGREATIDEPKIASSTSVTINGIGFVSGLFWQPLTRPRAYMKEAREIGKREGMDIVAIRHGTVMQAGFVSKAHGIGKGMYSLASALAGSLGTSWLGVFDLGSDLYAFVAVHDGAIVPGCDMIGNREDVEERLHSFYSYFQWEEVYTPADFSYNDGRTLDINKILTLGNLKKEYKLKQLTLGLSMKEVVFMVAAVAIGGSGLFLYTQWHQEQVRQQRINAIQIKQVHDKELAELNKKTRSTQTARALEHPWAKMPSASDFLGGCSKTIYSLPLVVKGWAFDNAVCANSGDNLNIPVSYKRTGNATANDFLDEIARRYQQVAVIDDDGNSGRFILHVKTMFGGDDPLDTASTRIASFQSHFQQRGIKFTLTSKPVVATATKLLPGQTQPTQNQPTKPDWNTFTFSFAGSDMGPEQLFDQLDAKGVRFLNLGVSLDPGTAKLTWTASGEIYAK